MKKFYLLGLIATSFVVNAQQKNIPSAPNQSRVTTKKQADYVPASPVRVNNTNTKATSGYNKTSSWAPVAQTMFDRPTNASTYRRIISYPNGKVSVNWTASDDGSTNGYLSRGSGYNHFNGTTWTGLGNSRIETERAGYPNLDYDPNNNREIILSHKVDTAGLSRGLMYSTNAGIGSNVWTSQVVLDTVVTSPGILWPRTVVSGNNLIVIASFTDSSKAQPNRVVLNGVRAPQVYSRLNLTSGVWEVKNQTLPEYDGSRYYTGGGDNYAIAANGNHVAILMGGLFDDMALWKSSDNGVSWTKTIIDSFPIPAYDLKQVLDTTFTCDGSVSVTVDESGNAHCFWSLARIMDKDNITDNLFTSFPGQNQILYWYEGRPDSIVTAGFSPEDPTDADDTWTIGSVIEDRAQYGSLSMTSAPYVVRSGDTLYLTYHSRTDNDLDASGIAFTDIFLVTSTDNGATWSDPVNLTAAMGFNTEQTFASVAAECSTKLRLTFIQATAQGFFDAETNPGKVGPFQIMYYEIPVADVFKDTAIIGTGVNEANDLFTVSANYPNPFRNSTIVPVNLTQKADVKITVMNILGEVVYSKNFDNTTVGVNQLEVNGNFKTGFYMYTVEAAGFKASGKMLAE